MEEFDEQELQSIIDSALSSHSDTRLSSNYLGLAETDIFSLLYEKLSTRIIGSELSSIFQDIRSEIISRKNYLSLKDLHTVTSNCRKCKLDVSPELPKWNVSNPNVLIVVESPSISSDGISLMISAFKESGFSSDDLCLTYVNRCPIKRKFEQNEVVNCAPYLHSEIQIMNPKLIVSLGSLPSSILFGTPLKIKDVRGQIRWLGSWPILSTYSPMYVIKSGGSSPEHFSSDIRNAYNFVNSLRK
jgi:uracil-DNA glycosylase family 4